MGHQGPGTHQGLVGSQPMTGSPNAAPFRTTLLEHRVAGWVLGLGPWAHPGPPPRAGSRSIPSAGSPSRPSCTWGSGGRAQGARLPLTLDRPSPCPCLGPAALGCQHACAQAGLQSGLNRSMLDDSFVHPGGPGWPAPDLCMFAACSLPPTLDPSWPPGTPPQPNASRLVRTSNFPVPASLFSRRLSTECPPNPNFSS